MSSSTAFLIGSRWGAAANAPAEAVARNVRRFMESNLSRKCQPEFSGDLLNVLLALVVLFRRFQMLQHERRIYRQRGNFAQVSPVIDFTAARNGFAEVDVQLDIPRQILGMAGSHPRPQLAEAIRDEFAGAVKARGTVDAVANIHVDGKSLAVYSANQGEVRIRTVGNVPAHHFDGEFGAAELHRIDDVAAIFDGGVEKLLGEILGMRPHPELCAVGAGDVGAAARSDCFG